MGVLPLEFMKDHTAEGIDISGGETFNILGISDLKPKGTVRLNINRENGRSESVTLRVRIDTAGEYEYYRHKGILNYVLHRLSA